MTVRIDATVGAGSSVVIAVFDDGPGIPAISQVEGGSAIKLGTGELVGASFSFHISGVSLQTGST